MVRKMLKAFIKVTADKTHFAIDIKNLAIFVYHFAFRYNPPEHNNTSYATSSLFNLPALSYVPHTSFHNIYQFTDTYTAPSYKSTKLFHITSIH